VIAATSHKGEGKTSIYIARRHVIHTPNALPSLKLMILLFWMKMFNFYFLMLK